MSLRAATYLAPCNRPLYKFVAESCGASELIDGRDWRELDSGSVDIAFVCSPPVIWLGGSVEAVAAPILTDPRFGGKPLYCSEVIVNRDSPFQSLEDLRGARWAINEPSSWSGYWVTLQRIGSWDFFSEVVEAGFHERALQMLASGEIDGAAIDSHVLGVVLRSAPQLAEMLRVVETLGPSPSQPVVVRSGLDPAFKDRIRERLLSLRDPLMNEYLVEGFAPAPDYSQIAAVVGPSPR
ncbi:MAG TPA: PhnD/SsuA/transferrin family substrate-binding protein [Candidatus Dormibacteraeota bacterium]|nr:PhnD/SsuA/transferrin family substrate-binding protein [Candidatus Dormibacteraeota bacterium]